MAKPRKRKTAATGSTKRRIIVVTLVLLTAALATLMLTEPRQLPAVIADHAAVRTAYAWRDTAQERVHNWMYPLAQLRTQQADPKSDGVGYKEKDREALDQLLQSKEGTTP